MKCSISPNRRSKDMSSNEFSRDVAIVVLMGLLAALLACPLNFAHASTTSKTQNSLGTVSYDTNPLMYTAGFLTKTSDAVTEVDGNLNLRINPLGTYMLFDEAILFCGMPIEKFRGVEEPFVLTYERQAHRTVQAIGCPNLLTVNHV